MDDHRAGDLVTAILGFLLRAQIPRQPWGDGGPHPPKNYGLMVMLLSYGPDQPSASSYPWCTLGILGVQWVSPGGAPVRMCLMWPLAPAFSCRVLTELVSKMRDMQMDKTELGCLRAIVLFNPGMALPPPVWPRAPASSQFML